VVAFISTTILVAIVTFVYRKNKKKQKKMKKKYEADIKRKDS